MSGRSAVPSALIALAGLAAFLIAGCERTGQSPAKTQGEVASQPVNASANQAAPTEPAGNEDDRETTPVETTSETRVVAYYFHRTMRCPTCLSIEKQSREAVEAGYADELESGQLEWHAVNIEAPGSEHFEQDFELEASALILAEMVGDEVVRWKNLTDVWELVEDSLEFQVYVWTELGDFL